jgi:hypothetical protein
VVKQVTTILLTISLVVLAYGELQVACAQWSGPAMVPQLPQALPSPPQQIMTLPDNALQPTLKVIPSAPQPVIGSGQSGSAPGSASGNELPTPEPTRTQASTPAASAAEPVREPVPPPVEKTEQAPPSEPSHSKTPWLVAAGVVAAFLIGRRTK